MAEIDDAVPVTEALARYYREHGLPPDGGAGSAWFMVQIGPLRVPLPNPPARKAAVLYHDMHHLATGYNTVFSQGEMIIAGYEIGTGGGRYAVAWVINLWMMALGLLVTPRRMFGAFVRGRRCDSLYRHPAEQDRFTAMSVGELKRVLRVNEPTPDPTGADRAAFAGWCAVAWLATVAPAALLGGALWLVVAGVRMVLTSR